MNEFTANPEQSDPHRAARLESHYDLRRRTLERMRDGSTDLDEATMRVDPAIYLDPAQAEREQRAIFSAMPILAGLSLDLPEPGDVMVFDALGPSILVLRDKSGAVRAFHNFCTHRAAQLLTACTHRTRLTCPFHGWTFDLEGKLVGLPGKEGFNDVDRAALALRPVAVAEKYGMIFVRLDRPEDPIDIDAHLGPMAAEVAHLDLGKARPVAASCITAKVNWKYCFDTYGESYHFATLHAETIGKLAQSNVMVYRPLGSHSRLGFPRAEFDPYRDLPEDQWPHTDYGGLYNLFPNVAINVNSIIGVGQFYGVSRIFPGPTPGSSMTMIATYQPGHADSAIDPAEWQSMHDFIVKVITDEDYAMAETAQASLAQAPAGFAMVFGRNEIALQHWHRNYARALAQHN